MIATATLALGCAIAHHPCAFFRRVRAQLVFPTPITLAVDNRVASHRRRVPSTPADVLVLRCIVSAGLTTEACLAVPLIHSRRRLPHRPLPVLRLIPRSAQRQGYRSPARSGCSRALQQRPRSAS